MRSQPKLQQLKNHYGRIQYQNYQLSKSILQYSPYLLYQLTTMQILQANRPKKPTPLDQQLQQAQAEVKLLRQQNQNLLNRITQLEKQQELFIFMKEELLFRREEQHRMTALMTHYQDITSQLNQKVKSLTEMHEDPKELAPTTIDCASRPQEQFELELPIMRNFRASCTKRTSRSDSYQKHKENHAITPKSKVNIDLSSIFDDQIPIKKKVFV